MRYYAPYIVSLIIILFIGSALFHKGYRPKVRNYKYGNPQHERLVQEYKSVVSDNNFLIFRLYIGSDNAGGDLWYSVTVEKPEMVETQFFASFGTPVIDKVVIADGRIKLVSGKGYIDINFDQLDEKMNNPLIFYMGKEVSPDEGSPDKI